MSWAMLALAGTVLCYGAATVLQDAGTRRDPGRDVLLAARLLRQLPYTAGLILDGLGFLLSLAALRRLPVFAVQAGVAGSIGVTAVGAALFAGERLSRRGWAALALLGAGLVAVAGSAAHEAARPVDGPLRLGLAAGVVVLVGLGVLAARRPGPIGAAGLAAVSGLGFGGVALAARLLTGDLSRLYADPLLWTLLGYGAIGLAAFPLALSRSSVTTVTAIVAVAETVAPGLTGILLLGDRARPGLGWLALAGFVVTVVAAGLVARLDPRPDGRGDHPGVPARRGTGTR
jgi:multidrug transporter EmrE-like cation transporter